MVRVMRRTYPMWVGWGGGGRLLASGVEGSGSGLPVAGKPYLF